MEVQNSSDLAVLESMFGEKWFLPILADIEAFEGETDRLLPEIANATGDNSIDWAFGSLFNYLIPDRENNGLSLMTKKGSRDVGAIVGMKWALCDAYDRAYPIWKSFTPEQMAQIDENWWEGFSNSCLDFCKEFAERLVPMFRDIKARAFNLASRQGLEEVHFMQGYVRGLQYLNRKGFQIGKPRHKRDVDRGKRVCVILFAMACAPVIEKYKGELSWPELHQLFEVFIRSMPGKLGGSTVDIDEETFVQILKRAGLKGVGKKGRPPSNEKGTSLNPRCP